MKWRVETENLEVQKTRSDEQEPTQRSTGPKNQQLKNQTLLAERGPKDEYQRRAKNEEASE
jgi:hypothetical protein